MAGRWTIEPGMGHAGGFERLGANERGATPWSGLIMHATMVALVLSVMIVVLLVTASVVLAFEDALHEMLTGFSWAPLDGLLRLILLDIFTEALGTPL